MKKLVIFDFDGVLFDSRPMHYESWVYTLKRWDIFFDKSLFVKVNGLTRTEQLKAILKYNNQELSDEVQKTICKEKNDRLIHNVEDLSIKDVSKDVLYTLDELKKRGIKIALASSSKNAIYTTSKLGLTPYFDVLIDGNIVKECKPAPNVYLSILDAFKLERKNAIIIEDSYVGIDAAKNAGIDVCGISYAKEYSLSTYKIDKISDVLKYIK